MKTACIAFARGCPRSMLDAAKFVDYFRINGWKITTNFREADIVLVGTCGFEIEHENQSIKFLSIANRKMNKNAQLVAFGCLAGINEPRILEEFNITTITRSTRDRLDKMINAETNISEIEEANDLSEYTDYIQKSFTSFDNLIAKSEVEFSKEFFGNVISSLSSGGVFTPFKKLYHRVYDDRNIYDSYKTVNDQRVFNLRVGSGCNGLCTYCAIKIAVGQLKSTPSDIILKQFEDGLSKGYKIFRLVSDDVGAYGQDDGADIIKLLTELFDNKENFQLSFDDFSPKWLIKYFPELLEIFSNNIHRLCYMGFPLQAGSEKILELMKREYTANDAKKCILALKQKANDLPIYTHVIVGFPNEEEGDFQASMKFFETVPFKGVASYKYSDRPNTPASEMFPKVSEEIKKERLMRLSKVIKQSN